MACSTRKGAQFSQYHRRRAGEYYDRGPGVKDHFSDSSSPCHLAADETGGRTDGTHSVSVASQVSVRMPEMLNPADKWSPSVATSLASSPRDLPPLPGGEGAFSEGVGRWKRDLDKKSFGTPSAPISNVYSENPMFRQRYKLPQTSRNEKRSSPGERSGHRKSSGDLGRISGITRKGAGGAGMWKKLGCRMPTPTQLNAGDAPGAVVTKELSKLSASSMQAQRLKEARPRGVKTFGRLLGGTSIKKQSGEQGGNLASQESSLETEYFDPEELESGSWTPDISSGKPRTSLNEAQINMEEFLMDSRPSLNQNHQVSFAEDVPISPEFLTLSANAADSAGWGALDLQSPKRGHIASGNRRYRTEVLDESRRYDSVQELNPRQFLEDKEATCTGGTESEVSSGPEGETTPLKSGTWKHINVNVVVEVLNDSRGVDLKELPLGLVEEVNGRPVHQPSISLLRLPSLSGPPGWQSCSPCSSPPQSPAPSAPGPSCPPQNFSRACSPAPQSPALSCPPAHRNYWDSADLLDATGQQQRPSGDGNQFRPWGAVPFSPVRPPAKRVLPGHQEPLCSHFCGSDNGEERILYQNNVSMQDSHSEGAGVAYNDEHLIAGPQESTRYSDTGHPTYRERNRKQWSQMGQPSQGRSSQPSTQLTRKSGNASLVEKQRVLAQSRSFKERSSRFLEAASPKTFRSERQFDSTHIGRHTLGESRWEVMGQCDGASKTQSLYWCESDSDTSTESAHTGYGGQQVPEGPRLKAEGSFRLHLPAYTEGRIWSLSEVKRLSGVWMKDLKASDDPGPLCEFLELGWIFQKAIMNSRRLEIDVTNQWIRMKAKLFGLFEQTEQISWDTGGCLVPRRDLRTGFTRVWLERIHRGFRQWSQWGEPVAGDKVEDYRLTPDGKILLVHAHLVREMGQILNTRTVFKRV